MAEPGLSGRTILDDLDDPGEVVAAVNGRFLRRPVTGVERFAREVTGRLAGRVRVVPSPSWARAAGGHAWEQLVLPSRVGPAELLWSPANTGPLAVAAQVITIHDAAPLDRPAWFRGAFARYYRLLLPRLVRRAARVLTSSRFSATRLAELAGVPTDAIAVVTPGVDRRRFRPAPAEVIRSIRARHGLPPRYLLAVGSRSPRKNLATLVAAWRLVRGRQPDLGLVIAGEATPTSPDDVPGEAGARLLGRVPDAELPGLYTAASAFVYPSLYEGFGLPVLEAMACGVPVVASCRGGIPEAVGDAGVLFDAEDPEELAGAIEGVLEDGGVRRGLRARGFRRARQLTWEATADRVLEILVRHRL